MPRIPTFAALALLHCAQPQLKSDPLKSDPLKSDTRTAEAPMAQPKHPGTITFVSEDGEKTEAAETVPESVRFAPNAKGVLVPVVRGSQPLWVSGARFTLMAQTAKN
jgi:hypothetical protein